MSSNSESSDNSPDKDPAVEDLSNGPNVNRTTATPGLYSQGHVELSTNAGTSAEVRVTSPPEVASQNNMFKETEDCLANQSKCISSSSAIPFAEENHNTPDGSCDNLTLNSNPSVSSLVCCDYADSSDASDDHT